MYNVPSISSKGGQNMEVFVAKQPIFNDKRECIAYELLYRDSLNNYNTNTDGDKATSEVIVNSFMNIGIKNLSSGKPCFINFTENLLNLKIPTYFNPESIVVEILENVEINSRIVEICKELKSFGYTIALDDFSFMQGDPAVLSLLPYVDIIKIDFLATSRLVRSQVKEFLKGYNLLFLAEKVETEEEYQEAIEDGYRYFQGYFFSKPIILQSNDIPLYFYTYFSIIQELDKPEPNISRVAEAIENDLSITYKLLKLINSPIIRPKYEIFSVKQAIVLLGLNEIKKWLYVLALRGDQLKNNSTNLQREILKLGLTRAKLGELIGQQEQKNPDNSKYFLLGMFSSIDALLNLPMKQILDELPLAEDVKAALLGEDNNLKKHLDFIKSIERLNMGSLEVREHPLSLKEDYLFSLYSRASTWADNVTNGSYY